jgi:hypothetical protein
MERKAAQYTSVVSVAVKAIAVARGYVANEGTGGRPNPSPNPNPIRALVCACGRELVSSQRWGSLPTLPACRPAFLLQSMPVLLGRCA